jgi:hypothetical protein
VPELAPAFLFEAVTGARWAQNNPQSRPLESITYETLFLQVFSFYIYTNSCGGQGVSRSFLSHYYFSELFVLGGRYANSHLSFNFQPSTFNFLRHPPRIAPMAQPEYPLPSHGGLGCESAWQGSGFALEAWSPLFFLLHFVRR